MASSRASNRGARPRGKSGGLGSSAPPPRRFAGRPSPLSRPPTGRQRPPKGPGKTPWKGYKPTSGTPVRRKK